MKRLIYMLLLVAMVGSALADVRPEQRLIRPQVNMPDASVVQWSWLGYLDGMMPRFLSPLLKAVDPRFRAPKPRPVDPVPPPLCDVKCLLRPIRAIAQ